MLPAQLCTLVTKGFLNHSFNTVVLNVGLCIYMFGENKWIISK